MEQKVSKGTARKSYKTWSKSSRKDDWTKDVRVEEIENGFVITLSEYGQKNGNYSSEDRKFYAKENPLADDDMVMDGGLDSAITNFIDNI